MPIDSVFVSALLPSLASHWSGDPPKLTRLSSRRSPYRVERGASRLIAKQQAAFEFCLSGRLRNATPTELNQVIEALAGQMGNRQDKPNAFLEIDLKDRIANSGYITLGDGGEQVYVQEYRERVERKVLEIVENHPAIAALRKGEALTDLQLVALERILRQELGTKLFSDLVSAEPSRAAEVAGTYRATTVSIDVVSNIRKAFNVKTGSLLGFLREQLEMEELSDYETVVQRNFEQFIVQHPFNADQIRFLWAVQTVFLQKRRIELALFYSNRKLVLLDFNYSNNKC